MGHSNIAITQKIYMHGRLATRREAMNLAGNVLLPPEVLAKVGMELPSSLGADGNIDSRDGSGCRQFSRQTPTAPSLVDQFKHSREDKNKPATGVPVAGWLNTLLGDLTGNRTRIARMRSKNISESSSFGDRVTKVDTVLQVRRRHWMLGVVAVNLAVKASVQI
jgi:hypothetical protein